MDKLALPEPGESKKTGCPAGSGAVPIAARGAGARRGTGRGISCTALPALVSQGRARAGGDHQYLGQDDKKLFMKKTSHCS